MAASSSAIGDPQPMGRPASRWLVDVAAGSALGILLGMLVGLSAAPVVATVVSGLVALLAGVFGLSDKLGLGLPADGARRLAAFGFAAAVATPCAILLRTGDWLSPSVAQHRRSLADIGIVDTKEQDAMLKFIKFGVPPPGTAATAKDLESSRNARQAVLYSIPTSDCEMLAPLYQTNSSLSDYLTTFKAASGELRKIGEQIAGLPEDRRKPFAEAAYFYLCSR